MKHLRLTENVRSFFGTDVREELRLGLHYKDLEPEELTALLLITKYWSGCRLYVPEVAQDRQDLAAVLVDLSNGLEEQVRLGEAVEPEFLGRVSRSLSTLAGHLAVDPV